MRNECPSCKGEAMDAKAKMLKRPVLCQRCGQELRMNLVYTTVLSLAYFALVIMLFVNLGVTGSGMLAVLLVTAGYIGACLLIPFEEKGGDSSYQG